LNHIIKQYTNVKFSNFVALIFVDLVGIGWAVFKVEDLSHTTEGLSLSLSPPSLLFPLSLSASFDFPHWSYNVNPLFIHQVYLERILRKPEIDAFAEELKPHQVIKVCFVSSYFW
jgi:hypothetical protein